MIICKSLYFKGKPGLCALLEARLKGWGDYTDLSFNCRQERELCIQKCHQEVGNGMMMVDLN